VTNKMTNEDSQLERIVDLLDKQDVGKFKVAPRNYGERSYDGYEIQIDRYTFHIGCVGIPYSDDPFEIERSVHILEIKDNEKLVWNFEGGHSQESGDYGFYETLSLLDHRINEKISKYQIQREKLKEQRNEKKAVTLKKQNQVKLGRFLDSLERKENE